MFEGMTDGEIQASITLITAIQANDLQTFRIVLAGMSPEERGKALDSFRTFHSFLADFFANPANLEGLD